MGTDKAAVSRREVLVQAAGAALAGPLLLSRADRAVGASKAAGKRPNILLIMTDQQFADVMSCRMGRQYLHTPAMDSLAASGTLFSAAYSSNPLCMPLRNSLFTGRYPHETRVTRNANPQGGLDVANLPCMGAYFRNAGYETAYFGKWHLCFNQKNPREHGFDVMNQGKSKDGPDARAADGATAFIARAHDKPFLLVASFLNPHNICEWARRLAGRKQGLNCGEIGEPPALDRLPPAPANLDPPRDEPDGMTLIRRAYQVPDGSFPVAKFTADDWRRHRWGYYRMTELVDAEIAKVLGALRKAGLEEDTLVVFTSDHGDCAGAHRFNQKTVFYEESARVPMIVSWKGRTPAGTCDKLVNTGVDILPTLLDCAGVDIPARLPGRSLLGLAMGKSVPEWRDFVIVQNDMCQTGTVDGLRPTMQGRMIRTARYKYCVYSRGQRRESLVDLQADPLETTDLAGQPAHRDTLLAHRQMLARFAKEHNDKLAAELLADDVKPIPW